MAHVETIEGTWDELSRRSAEFQGKKLRLTVVDDGEAAPQNLADFLGDFSGSIEGSGDNNSDDSGVKFADHLAQKHQDNRL